MSSSGSDHAAIAPISATAAANQKTSVNEPRQSAIAPPIWGDTAWAIPNASVVAENTGPNDRSSA